MSSLLRLIPVMAGLATSQVRHRARDVKISLYMSAALALGALTAYVGVFGALVALLRHPLGLAGAFAVTGLGAFLLALAVALAFKIYRDSKARKWRREERALSSIASTSLALAPIVARRNARSNPKLALATAAIVGLALASFTRPRN